MNARNKNDLFSKRNIRFTVGLVIVALVAGVYFLFRPFPAGPSLEAAAKVPVVKEAASVNGWSAYANPPTVVKVDDLQQSRSPVSASIKRLDIGAGYVLETSSQGSKIVAPSAPAVASALVQRLDIGNGYVLENSRSNSRIVAPSAPSVVAPAAAASGTQRLDIGNGYVLENSSQGSRIVAPIAPLKMPAMVTNADYLKKIDIGSGYMLIMGSGSRGEIVPAP